MVVVPDYHGFRIEVEAIKAEGAAADGRYNADVRMLRLFSRDKPCAERVLLQADARSRRARRRDLGQALG